LRCKIVSLIQDIIDVNKRAKTASSVFLLEEEEHRTQNTSSDFKQRLEEFKEYVTSNYIQFQNINDEFFDIIDHFDLSHHSEYSALIQFINDHYSEQRSKIMDYLRQSKKGNLQGLKQYTNENSIILKQLNTKIFDILSYAIQHLDPSSEAVQFIIQQGGQYDFSVYQRMELTKWPLFIALSTNKYKIATTLLKNHMDINEHPLNLIEKLSDNKHAIRYLLQHGYNKSFVMNSINTLILQRNSETLKVIFNHYIFDNNFILKLILFGKKQICLTQHQLRKVISDEINKLGKMSKYQCIASGSIKKFLDTFDENVLRVSTTSTLTSPTLSRLSRLSRFSRIDSREDPLESSPISSRRTLHGSSNISSRHTLHGSSNINTYTNSNTCNIS